MCGTLGTWACLRALCSPILHANSQHILTWLYFLTIQNTVISDPWTPFTQLIQGSNTNHTHTISTNTSQWTQHTPYFSLICRGCFFSWLIWRDCIEMWSVYPQRLIGLNICSSCPCFWANKPKLRGDGFGFPNTIHYCQCEGTGVSKHMMHKYNFDLNDAVWKQNKHTIIK